MTGAATPSSPARRRVESDALRDTGPVHRGETLAVEEPLEIQIVRQGPAAEARSVSLLMRTPGNDVELALGFLHGEGILQGPRDLRGSVFGERNVLRVSVRPDLPFDDRRLSRNVYATSSCGVCGKASIDALTSSLGLRMLTGNLLVSERVVWNLPEALRAGRTRWAESAGLHAAALFDAGGGLMAVYEDVGRHNALDKLVGASLLSYMLPWSERIIVITGRASFEIVQKAMMAGAPMVCARGAPSTLALDLAQAAGITLVGYQDEPGCSVYCHPERVRADGSDRRQ